MNMAQSNANILEMKRQSAANAREYKQQILGEINPTQRGLLKQQNGLLWVYRWGWSSPKLVDWAGGSKNRGLSARMLKLGFLNERKCLLAGIKTNLPTKILTLSELGIGEVEKNLSEDIITEYDINPDKINQLTLKHDYIVQSLTANVWDKGGISQFYTPYELDRTSVPGKKLPDAVWIIDNDRYGIEVEISPKRARKLDQFVFSVVQAILDEELDRVIVYVDGDNSLRNYRDHFTVGRSVTGWHKNHAGQWLKQEKMKIPPEIKGKIICKKLVI